MQHSHCIEGTAQIMNHLETAGIMSNGIEGNKIANSCFELNHYILVKYL